MPRRCRQRPTAAVSGSSAPTAPPRGPGHVCAVVPETAAAQARRDADGHDELPLQSQAGAVNLRRGSGTRAWWNDALFRDRGFFVHG